MTDKSLIGLWLLLFVTASCFALDRESIPDAKRDVVRMTQKKFTDNFQLNFKVKNLGAPWWKEQQVAISTYMKNYGLIPEECNGEVEILDAGVTENQSLGWARFRCKK